MSEGSVERRVGPDLRLRRGATAVASLVLLGVLVAPIAGAGSLATALEEGEASVALRYRLESVSRDVANEADARASTLRTALAFETGEWRHLQLFVEAENVAVLGNELYDNRGAGSLANGVTGRAVVADPALTAVNQAYAQFEAGGTRLRAGRQEILLGDQRFVGNVGWRQHHQSFDGLRLEHAWSDRLEMTYAYLDSVQRIFGDRRDLTGHVAQIALEGQPVAVRIYALSVDWDDPAQADLSTSTVGAEVTGSRPVGSFKALFEVEWATQRDGGANPEDFTADYLHLMIGGSRAATSVRLGFERLDGTPGSGRFTTPLATLHKFNGWADLFLTTPTAGLVDRYLQAGGKRNRWAWLARYHRFESAHGSTRYGSEVDAQLTWTAPWEQTVALTAASYDAADLGVDTDKWMLWTTYSF